MSNQLLTTGQIADKLGVHRSTVHLWEKSGQLKPAQVANGIRLFKSTDVDKLIKARGAAS